MAISVPSGEYVLLQMACYYRWHVVISDSVWHFLAPLNSSFCTAMS